jgi:hypothetical protein
VLWAVFGQAAIEHRKVAIDLLFDLLELVTGPGVIDSKIDLDAAT